jgi:hypothetical protein
MNYERTFDLNSLAFDGSKYQYVVDLCSFVCPTADGNRFHDFVTQNRHKWKSYSSCGDLWNFVPWAMGCTDKDVINRDDREIGLVWEVQKNISKTYEGAKRYNAWNPYSDLWIPQYGHMLFIGQYPDELEHVSIIKYVHGNVIHSYDFGQFDKGKKCSLECTRTVKNDRVYSENGKSRKIIGSVDPTKLPISRFAIDLKTIS